MRAHLCDSDEQHAQIIVIPWRELEPPTCAWHVQKFIASKIPFKKDTVWLPENINEIINITHFWENISLQKFGPIDFFRRLFKQGENSRQRNPEKGDPGGALEVEDIQS